MKRAHELAVLIILLAANVVAAPSAVVKLRANPDHVLMGLPSLLEMTVTNTGAEPFTLTGQARMNVSGPGGTTFFAKGGQENPNIGVFAQSGDASLQVSPGTTRQFYWRTFEFSNGPIFFNDERFRATGIFLLQVEVLTTDRNISFSSESASLTVDKPSGTDAAVWSLIASQGGPQSGGGLAVASVGEKVAASVLANYADSRYAAYFAPFLMRNASGPVHERTLRWALTQDLSDAFATELKLTLMEMYAADIGNAIHSFDLATAQNCQARAGQLEKELSNSRLTFAAERARQLLEELPTRDQVALQYQARIKELPPVPLSVAPFVQCVDLGSSGDTDQVVVFGYSNPNAFGKYIPAGDRNRLQPSRDDVRVPVYFGGTQKSALTVIGRRGQEVTWTLDGHSVTSSEKSDRCAPPPSTASISLLIDCIQRDGDSVTATFGYLSNNSSAIRVPLGASNMASGGSIPPTIFLPGEHHGVLTVRSKRSESPAWTLQGTTLTASPAGIPCGADGEGHDEE